MTSAGAHKMQRWAPIFPRRRNDMSGRAVFASAPRFENGVDLPADGGSREFAVGAAGEELVVGRVAVADVGADGEVDGLGGEIFGGGGAADALGVFPARVLGNEGGGVGGR